MFSFIINVLEIIAEDEANVEQRFEENNLLESMLSFDFAFSLHLMKTLLGITNELSRVLQRKDQDIVNAEFSEIVQSTTTDTRDNGWDSFLDQVSNFCGKHDIIVPNMDDISITRGRL